jgi:membrane associated rhomboid family serine protease
MFLHGSLLHLLLNTFTLVFFGSGLEFEVGARRFWRIFLLGGIVGGLGWVLADLFEPRLVAWLASGPAWGGGVLQALHLHRNAAGHGICIGASGGVFALIGAYAALFPRHETMILVLFWPVRLKARTLAVILGVVTVGEAVLGLGQVAYAAHLAGGVAGYVYGVRLRRHVT